MKRALLLFLVTLVGCSGSTELATRFEAEQDLWKLDREFQKLGIAPQLVDSAQWETMAARYTALGDRYGAVAANSETTRVGQDVRTTRLVAAQAYTRTAEIAMALEDTSKAVSLFQKIETDFEELPGVVAGAALARGQVLQGGGRTDEALEAFHVVQRILEEESDQAIPSNLMTVPLGIARLSSGEDSVRAYAQATTFYEGLVDQKPETLEAAAAQSRLVDVATDLRDWELTEQRLQDLEYALRKMEDPPQHPAEVRLALGQIRYQGLNQPAEAVATWESLLKDYPESESAPRALMALSGHYASTGNPQQSLESLAKIPENYPNDLEVGPIAELAKARLLEREDRWTEAIQVYKRIPIDFPLSEAALQSHVDIVAHYERVEDEAGMQQALVDAEQALMAFVDRYPSEQAALQARQRLVLVYFKQDRHAEGVQELLSLADAMRGSPQGLQFLVLAAQTYEKELNKPAEAAGIFDQVSEWYPNTETAKLARAEAKRIRDSL